MPLPGMALPGQGGATTQISAAGGAVKVNSDGSITLGAAPLATGLIDIPSAGYLAQTYGIVLQIDPPQAASDPFLFSASSTSFPGDPSRTDYVVRIGHNMKANSGSFNPAHPTNGVQIEQYYAPDSSHHYAEYHLMYEQAGNTGVQYRWISSQYRMDAGSEFVIVSIDCDKLNIQDRTAANQWVSIQSGYIALNNNMVLQKSNNGQDFLKQLNAAGSAFISLLTLEADDYLYLMPNSDAAGVKLPSLDVIHGSAALATTATSGFLWIREGAGAPTGVPGSHTGTVPLYYDTSNHKIWVYDGGWKGVVVS